MKWLGPIKPTFVRLPRDLHLAIKSAAPTRSGTVERAYEEALTQWLVSGETTTTAEAGAIAPSPKEEHTALASLQKKLDAIPPAIHGDLLDVLDRVADLFVRRIKEGPGIGLERIGEIQARKAARQRRIADAGGKPGRESGPDAADDEPKEVGRGNEQ